MILLRKTGFARNKAIIEAKEAVNENDQTRKRFEIMAREVFKKFKACINIKEVNRCRLERDALDIIYKNLQSDREKVDISDIMRELHAVVDETIETNPTGLQDQNSIYDISKIDFDRLRKEFERSRSKRTTVQHLKQAIENRLTKLLLQNPLRINYQEHYEKLVREYNQEKDQVTIEKTFEALFDLYNEMTEEECRALREELDEETLAVYDLLRKPTLDKSDIVRIKKVANELLTALKKERLKVENWREKEATRDAVHQSIYDFLYDEKTGLPKSYTDDNISTLTADIFTHVYRVYPTLPSPIYSQIAS